MSRFAIALLLLVSVAAPAGAADPLRVSAPTALMPAARRIVDGYAGRFGVDVQLVERGTSDGIAAVKAGDLDVALADSGPGDETLVQTAIAYLPLALIANSDARVSSVKSADIRGIFDGTISNWSAVGGASVPIVRFERPSGSAIDRLATTIFRLPTKRRRGQIDDTSAATVDDVRATPGGIGIVVLPYAGDLSAVRVLAIDGRAPDLEGLRGGYPLVNTEIAITARTPTLGISRFIAYVRSATDAWRASSLIPVRDLPSPPPHV